MIYFDHAATSFPKSKATLDAFVYAANTYANAGRGSYEASLQASRMLYQTREDIKKYVHAGNGEVVFTSGTTMAFNIIIKGMFHKGDHILTTALEHNSILRPLYEMEKQGVEVDILSFKKDGTIDIEEFISKRKPNTKAMIMTLVSNVFGVIQPVKQIAEIAHAYGMLVIVDAAQAVGHMDINMKEMGIDILCFSGHKGLRTPRGIGAIVMKQAYAIDPLLSGGSGFSSFEKRQPKNLPEHLEAGTLPIELIASLQAALKEESKENKKQEQRICTYFIEKVKQISNVEILCEENTNRCALVSLRLHGIASEEAMDLLSQNYDICVRGGIHCAPLLHKQLHTETCGLLRFSFSKDNTIEEVDIALKALQEIMEEVCE
ncbi:aminotransferase class V-fold PLP-dependent enzyme [Amedibacterium intestinale]|uniref:aminotransferase class V-fold PLP-dependent enzyme n=1 Tax=Amedibacterium intestinale TaxID=2583452 RepID=UPI000E4A2EAB|nr:aminotransferase class V-fold PLP-dependent enzyme [Amedibacterium intestinale]RHO24572.1 aminotransferase class V-fold PLP-dependent enzyme [Eubacterium sp. AM18-26]RHO28854.1 aminotransferase class V-fold PLP-dependent enzyme [Eubacterium sp. AM18-10LB-B]